ncbi:Fc.00g042050.m01.CDS01 [Cosmosporella sp. VM-42]
MGRTEPSVGQPPASFRRDVRAKKAKATVNQVIPSLLSTHPRARRGIEAAELVINPSPIKKSETATGMDKKDANANASTAGVGTPVPRITLQVADTLCAARSLTRRSSHSPRKLGSHSFKEEKVAILNMASPLSPGGGFLNGATSQEESLCMRTTLLPSLRDEYYRLPELGAVYTPDVLVFRDEQADDVLDKKDRWFVDCITAAMLRSPEIKHDSAGRGTYENEKDRELALQKMKMVMRICQAKGVKKVVLGAWGCGAYGNPVNEVATAWRKVLLPRKEGNNKGKGSSKNKGKRESWDEIEEIVFAIKDPGMAESFRVAFGDGLLHETTGMGEDDDEDRDETRQDDADKQELQARIQELELRIETTTNPQVKQGLLSILSGLNARLPKDEASEQGEESDPESSSGEAQTSDRE